MLFLLRSAHWSRSSSSLVAGAFIALGLAMASPARATNCAAPGDCPSGFCVSGICCDAACDTPCHACRASQKESGDMDGICGIMKVGKVCAGHCDGDTFSFVEAARCDQAGQCVAVPTDACLLDDPCKFDLCGDDGCEHVIKLEGTSCGNGKVCTDVGVCGADPSSSASSGGGAGGAGGADGAGGAGGSSTVAGSGTDAASSSGVGGGYPPSHYSGCGCRTADGHPGGGAAALGLAAVALLRRRRARS